MLRRLLLAVTLCVLTPTLAHAQIYAWRDASGHLVLSDKPKDPSAKTYSVDPPRMDTDGHGVEAAADTTTAAAGTTGTSFRVTKAAFSRRAAEYDDLIVEHSTRHDLDPNFVRAVIQAESAFNPRARSPKGAMGLMQLMPQTARAYGVFDPYNAAENIRAGVSYLKSLLVRFNQNIALALAAYNAGPAAVEKYGRTVPPYRETRNYVAKITSASAAAAPTSAAPPATRIYKTIDIVDGRPVLRFTNKPVEGADRVTAAERR